MFKIYLRKSIIAKRVATFIRKAIFLKSTEFKCLKNTKGNKRIIFLSEVDHGNLGDHAINYAVRELMFPYKSEFDNEISICRKFCLASIKLIGKQVGENDVIIIPGGGWIGTLWKESGELFIKIMETCSRSKIIVFPQTITFESSQYGRKQEKKLFNAIQNCTSLFLMVREKKSYDFLINKMPKENSHVQYLLAPDAALSIHPNLTYKRNNSVGFCFRKDQEKIVSSDIVSEIKEYAITKGNAIIDFDTVQQEHILPEQRKKNLYNIWGEMSKMKLVITDRLHGMIFAVITNTPCLAFNNINGKVFAVYDLWLKDNKNVEVLNISSDDWKKEFNNLINCNSDAVGSDDLDFCFENMRKKLKDFLEVRK